MTTPLLPVQVIAPEVQDGIRIMPVMHERVDFASVVRLLLHQLQPRTVAVELPTTLAQATQQAVQRLPRASVVISETDGADALLWTAMPGDPLVEALRWAHENDRRAVLIDPDVPYEGQHRDLIPDTCTMWELGLESFFETMRSIVAARPASDSDLLREKGMAHHLEQALDHHGGPILAFVGAAHADRLAANLRSPTAPPLARQRRDNVLVRHLHPDSLTAILPDPPLAHAVFETLRGGSPSEAADFAETVSRRVELLESGLRLITGQPPEDSRKRLENVVQYAARHACRTTHGGEPVVDRLALGTVVWQVAAASYLEQTRESTSAWQGDLFFDFARRYARIQGNYAAGLYEWVVAARGVADDNLAWEVFDAASAYPWQEETAEIATARVDGDMLDIGTRKLRFRRRFLRIKQRPVLVPVRRRPHPDDPREWLEGFAGDGICSYPPEDIVVEDYGRFLQQKAVSNLAAQNSRSEVFTTSLLDGVDVRETMRNWHEARVWVHEIGRAPGQAGSVVVIFDDPEDSGGYPYRVSWLGEHSQESDMAFYATDPGEQIVGPGIMRATYGGFMLTYPPGRLFDVWRDPDYRFARSRSEVLIMAALDYSTDKLVVHVAARPPGPPMHDLAARQGKRLVHIPLGSLSPVTLKRLRVVHILAGKDKRTFAKDYVW